MSYFPVKTDTVLPLTTLTADFTSRTMTNRGYRGLIFDVEAGAITDTPSATINIQAKDPAAPSVWTTILTSAAVVAAVHLRLIVYPGTTAAANLIINQPAPREFRVFVDGTWGGTDAIPMSIAVTYCP